MTTAAPTAIAGAPSTPPPGAAAAKAGAQFPTLLLLLMLLLLPLATYWSTTTSIVTIWERSDTFAHGYLIAPITAWLVWQRRDALRAQALAPCWPALLALAGCGMVWLLATVGDVQVVRQYALVAMLPVTVLAMMGTGSARVLAFPLLFLLLGVPVGDSLIEPLMAVTANFTVAALRLSGLPVLHEGNSFMLPSGSWSVVEACSGLRYLIASATAGVLYAYLIYTRWWKRLLFVLVALVMPVLANGLRAYMIVMIGHYSDMTLAVGVDHLLYGWVFFGLVIFVLFLLGARWQDRPLPATAAARAAAGPVTARHHRAALAGMAAAILLVLGMWPAYGAYLARADGGAAPAALASFQARAPATAAFTGWQPGFAVPAAALHRYYLQQQRPVGLSLLYYRGQRGASKLITSTNRLTPMMHSAWHLGATAVRQENLSDHRQLVVRESMLHGDAPLLVWSWYWIDGRTTTSDTVGKLLQLRQTVFDGFDDGAAVMLFTPVDEDPAAARATLRAFASDHIGAIDATLARTRQQRGATP
jgi:exosortase A